MGPRRGRPDRLRGGRGQSGGDQDPVPGRAVDGALGRSQCGGQVRHGPAGGPAPDRRRVRRRRRSGPGGREGRRGRGRGGLRIIPGVPLGLGRGPVAAHKILGQPLARRCRLRRTTGAVPAVVRPWVDCRAHHVVGRRRRTPRRRGERGEREGSPALANRPGRSDRRWLSIRFLPIRFLPIRFLSIRCLAIRCLAIRCLSIRTRCWVRVGRGGHTVLRNERVGSRLEPRPATRRHDRC